VTVKIARRGISTARKYHVGPPEASAVVNASTKDTTIPTNQAAYARDGRCDRAIERRIAPSISTEMPMPRTRITADTGPLSVATGFAVSPADGTASHTKRRLPDRALLWRARISS
jgi:hypothetical protein